MAKSKMPQLVLGLEGDQIPAQKFVAAAQDFFNLLDEVASEVTGKKRPVDWSVSLEKGSVLFVARPFAYGPGVAIRKIMATVNAGLNKLEKKATRPPGFSDAALGHAHDLAAIADGRLVKKAKVQLRRDKDLKPIEFRKVAEHVEEILGPKVSEYGSIEGYLETVSIRGVPHVSLYDVMTDQAVRCNVQEEKLNEAWRAMLSRHRVVVSGFITYRKAGTPLRIDADEIVEIGQDPIDFRRVRGILTRAV